LELNKTYSEQWPVITQKGVAPADAEEWQGVPDKFKNYFSSEPGEGS